MPQANTTMKNLLGIDYGRSKIGISLASGQLADPLQVIHYKEEKDLMVKLLALIEKYKIDEMVVGISEGVMANQSKEFGDKLLGKFGLPVHYGDETLSSQDAQALAIKAGKSRKTRAEMEDAYAATIMLQNYIDNRL